MRRSLLLIAGGALVLSLTAPAVAHDKSYKTRLTISEPQPFEYEGDVISRSRKCVRNRELVIWHDVPAGDDERIADFQANRRGHWSFIFVGEEYYVTAKRVVRSPGDHQHVCKGDRSPTA